MGYSPEYRGPTTDSFVICLLSYSEADSDLVCQPGARWMDINATLKQKGEWVSPYDLRGRRTILLLRYPAVLSGELGSFIGRLLCPDLCREIDPALGATIVGMVSTGCSGSKILELC